MSPAVREALAEFASRARTLHGARVREIRLFGSWARGEPRADSDVDVFVLLEGATREDERALIDLASEIFTRRQIPLMPLVMSTEQHAQMVAHDRRLVRDIAREGVAL